MENSEQGPGTTQSKGNTHGKVAVHKAEVKTDDENELDTLPEMAMHTKTMAESLWESNNGEPREYKICLPKREELATKQVRRQVMTNLRGMKTRISEKTAITANPYIPQTLSTTHNSIDHEICVSSPKQRRKCPKCLTLHSMT